MRSSYSLGGRSWGRLALLGLSVHLGLLGCAKSPSFEEREPNRWRVEQPQSQLPESYVGITGAQMSEVKRDWSSDLGLTVQPNPAQSNSARVNPTRVTDNSQTLNPMGHPSSFRAAHPKIDPLTLRPMSDEEVVQPNPFGISRVYFPRSKLSLAPTVGFGSQTPLPPMANLPMPNGGLTPAAKAFLATSRPIFDLDESYRTVRVKLFPIVAGDLPGGDPMDAASDLNWVSFKSDRPIQIFDSQAGELVDFAEKIEIVGGSHQRRFRIFRPNQAQPVEINFFEATLVPDDEDNGTELTYITRGSASQPMRQAAYSYQGKFALSESERGTLYVVNYLNVERYLHSVVGAEMPANFPLESLRAQAMAARTYTIRRMIESRSQGLRKWDILPTTSHQCYLGKDKIRPSTIRAVDSTAGQIVSYKGEPIYAMYHSNSGGVTVPAAEVYQSGNYSYLTAVADDPYVKTKDFFGPWKAIVDTVGLKRRLKSLGVGLLEADTLVRLAASPRNQTVANRTWELDVEVSRGGKSQTLHLDRNQSMKIQAYMGLPSRKITNEAWAAMVSNQRPQPESSQAQPNWSVDLKGKASFELTGYGNGHGVGLSQWGAYIYGDANGLHKWTGERIVQKYYPGAVIESLKGPQK